MNCNLKYEAYNCHLMEISFFIFLNFRVDDETLRVKTEFPGLRVEVSTDWGVNWQQYFNGMPVTNSDAIFVTK